MTCPNCDSAFNKAGRLIRTNKELDKCAICGEPLMGLIGAFKPVRKVLILGIDGYIGWPLALHLLKQGYEVAGIDNLSRRQRVEDIKSNSLTPISTHLERGNILGAYPNFKGFYTSCNLHDDAFYIKQLLNDIQPDTIIHLAEQPSAPWSMIDSNHCNQTQYENVIGTLNLLWAMKEVTPKAHLIKLGTMGEYGTPDCEIPEGEIPEHPCKYINDTSSLARLSNRKCPMASLPFPRSPGSFYHLSKVHDTHNIIFACKNWDLTSTDIMQGIVYGLTNLDESLVTRFDYDQYFGTVINRFCAQAISNHPLTIYGTGQQIRGYLPLKDSIQCLNIAIDNPPKLGTYRTFNQYESTYSINNLANIVLRQAKRLGLEPNAIGISNPRTEAASHIYKPISEGLRALGYIPTTDIKHEIYHLLAYILQYKDRVNHKVIKPTTNWR